MKEPFSSASHSWAVISSLFLCLCHSASEHTVDSKHRSEISSQENTGLRSDLRELLKHSSEISS